jgi:peptidoglycan/xylan/chitin deacetylase (PgdA/CDA1 family)
MKPRKYGPFEYSAIIDRPPLHWPDGARVALWIGLNVEFYHLDHPLGGTAAPNVTRWGGRDYANRVGIFRMMEMFDKHNLPVTGALNADLCRYHPRIVQEGNKRKWEWIGHGTTSSIYMNELTRKEQRKVVADTLDTIEEHSGLRPRGWLGQGGRESWDTLDVLTEAGVEYICDWCNDDQPVTMQLENGREIVAVQYASQANDRSELFHRNRTPEQFGDTIRRTFDVLYRESVNTGKVMCVALHTYLSGVPHCTDALDSAFAHICGHDRVWRTTGSGILDAYRKQKRAETKDGEKRVVKQPTKRKVVRA